MAEKMFMRVAEVAEEMDVSIPYCLLYTSPSPRD